MNRYNSSLYKVEPATTPTYAISPAEAQQLERMTQPTQAIIGVPGQTSATQIDASAIFEPLPTKEQFSPVERAWAFMLRSALFVIGALIITVASMWKLRLGSADSLFLFATLLLVTLIVLNRQEQHYSASGLAIRHQDAARDVLHTIVASNETVTLQRLENEDKQHEREISLRRELAQGYLKQIGGAK